jgi:hypothetical protein
MAKKNSIIAFAETAGVLSWTVGNAGTITMPLASLSDELTRQAMIHGLNQKVSDGAAMSKEATAGMTPEAIVEAKYNAMLAIANRLIDGDWSARSGDGSGPIPGIIFRAFAEYARNEAAKKGVTVSDDRIKQIYDARDKSGQLALRTVPEIAAIIERMKTERGPVAAKVDANALLGELGITD